MVPEERHPRLERVEFELRAAGGRIEQSKPLRSGIHTRGYLPHVKHEGASYFVTFRLANSLPKEVFFKILGKRARRLAQLSVEQPTPAKLAAKRPASDAVRQIERDYFREIEEYLDKGCGECWLRRPEIAELLSRALLFFEAKRYQLKAWVVMPTHVHVVLWPMPNHSLSAILMSWKGYTAHQANKLLGRVGQLFWQPESYDHWIRNEAELDRCCRYVINNPVKARLCKNAADWPWSSAYHGRSP